jgi:putative ABC transport system permease protein
MGLTAWGLEPVRPGRLRLRSALALYRRRLRRRRWIQDLLAVLGIAAGVALLYATQVAATSLSAPVARLNEGIVGAGQLQVLARGGATLDEHVYDQVVRLPGVRRAAPILQVPGNLVGTHGQGAVTLFGADPRVVKLRGALLRGFSSSDAAQQQTVVVPEPTAKRIGLRFGNDVRLQLAGRTVAVPAAVAGRAQIGGLVDTSIALVPLRYLQELAGVRGRVTRVLVEAEAGQIGAVERRLRDLRVAGSDVRRSTYETRLFEGAAMPTTAASLIFAVLSALVGWMFAICALLVTASDRRRLVVQQQRQGFPPSATVLTLLVDAAVIGIAGVLLGLVCGELISRHGFRSDVSFLSGAFPIGDVRTITWQSVATAVVGGLAAAVIGVLAPVRELVLQSLRPARSAHGLDGAPAARRAVDLVQVGGVIALSAALVITIAAPGLAVVGLVVLGVAVACVLPTALRLTIAAMRRVNRLGRSSAAVELGLHQLRSRRWRTRGLAIATIGAVAVFGATSLQGARLNLQDGLTDLSAGLNAPADIWVTAPGAGDSIGTATFPPDDTQRLATVPGVANIQLYRAALLDVADRRAWILAPADGEDGTPASRQILDGPPDRTARLLRHGGWATMSRALAGRLGVRIGERVVLPAPQPITVRVAAITTNLGWSSGAIVVSAKDYRRGWPSTSIAAYHGQLAAGSHPEAVRRRIIQQLGPRSGLVVETASQRAERQNAVAEAGLSRLREITVLTVLAAVLAMAAAMTGLLWQHRYGVAANKLLGVTTGTLWRSLLFETCTLFGVGVMTGAIFGLLGQVLCTRGVASVTGFPVIVRLQPGTILVTAGVVLVATMLAVLVPGRMVARTNASARE